MGGTRTAGHCDDTDPDGLAALVRSRVADRGLVVSTRGIWIDVDGPDLSTPAQGWKLHVSARPSTLRQTLDRVIPVLLETPCRFKLIRSLRLMRDLNSAQNQPGAVGKAFTIYPAPTDLTSVAEALCDALAGLEGPRILSDRQVRPDAPVYYRFGPFRARYRVTENGDFELAVVDPSGVHEPGAATPTYQAPRWLADPFDREPPQPQRTPAGVTATADMGTSAQETGPVLTLGGHYRVDKGVTHSAKGAVYRAVDIRTGCRVIVKEARSHVHELTDGADARIRLRNERHVLELLQDLDWAPRFVDHFRHGGSEFLVTTEMGGENLRQEVATNGPYLGDTHQRGLIRLARNLLEMLDSIHDRGIVVRDLSPKNIVVDDSNRPHLVDFEISQTTQGPLFFGWTPGYSPAQQERHEPATRSDDYYALGTTLYFAATGMDPVWLTDNPHNHDVDRLAASLSANLPDGELATAIVGLASPDPLTRSDAAETIRRSRPAACLPSPSAFDPPEPDALLPHLLAETHRHARDLIAGVPHTGGGFPSPTNVYHGSAGIGTELLEHRGDPATSDLVRSLAYWTCGFHTVRELPPGLLLGSTGSAVFLAAAGAALGDEHLLALARRTPCPAPHQVRRLDYSHGLAGVGVGQLLLGHLTGDVDRTRFAADCVDGFRDGAFLRELRAAPPDYADCGAVSQTVGFAHGLAGIAHFLLLYRGATGDFSVDGLVEDSYRELAGHVPPLIDAARQPAARPMHLSFCQGLGGIGTTLLRAAATLGEDAYLSLAVDVADCGMGLAPRVPVVSQCCGLAGWGEFVLDLAQATESPEHGEHARRIAQLLLLRSVGAASSPTFPDHTVTRSGGGWASGTSGILSYLRRLADPTTPRLWVGDELQDTTAAVGPVLQSSALAT